MNERTALVAGSTGLVGGFLLERLLEHDAYGRVIALVRRPTGREHTKLVELVIDFDDLPTLALPKVDDVYCALGTTIAAAGSKAAFKRVDHTYVVELARAGARVDASRFLVVSSVGADSGSRIFYSRTKGRMEREVAGVPYRAVHIFRPSIIDGERRESRPGERAGLAAMRALGVLMIGPLKRYRAIHADTIAQAMIAAAMVDSEGVHVFESEMIAALARSEAARAAATA